MWQSVNVRIVPVPSASLENFNYGALGRELRKVLPQQGGIVSPKVNNVSNIQKLKKIKQRHGRFKKDINQTSGGKKYKVSEKPY